MVDDLEEAFVEAGGADLGDEVLAGCGVGAVERCGSRLVNYSDVGGDDAQRVGLGDSRAKSIIGGAFAFVFAILSECKAGEIVCYLQSSFEA